jgi:hypothetical protein
VAFSSTIATIVNSPSYSPSLDGVYENIEAPDQYVVDTIDTSLSAIVGGAEAGEVGVPTPFSDMASLKDNFGFNVTDPYSLARNGSDFLTTGANNCLGVRVSDNSDTSAIYVVTDGQQAPAPMLSLTGLETGERLNIGSISIAKGYAYSAATPTARLTIRPQYGNPEIWDGIVGYTSDGNGNNTFDMPTLMGNLAAAVSSGTTQRGPSQYFIGTPGTSTASAFAETTFAVTTPGTNGTSNLTSNDLIGQDGDSRTGMYALTGSGVWQYILADNVDASVAGEQAAFEAREGCTSVVLLGNPGLTKSTAIAAKQANNVSAISQLAAIEWVTLKNPVTGIATLVPPLGLLLGAVAVTPSEQSIGQTPANGFVAVLATEHSVAQPWSKADQDALTAAGIIYISKQTGGNLARLPHGQNASCIPGQDQLSYTRLTNELALFTGRVLNPFVDKLQSISSTDPLRAHIVAALDSGYSDLKNRGRIDDFKVISDLSINTPASIAAGYLYIKLWVRYLSTARYIMATLQGGTTVDVTTATAPYQLAQAA